MFRERQVHGFQRLFFHRESLPQRVEGTVEDQLTLAQTSD